jgi:peptide/nickel transport system permease protein
MMFWARRLAHGIAVLVAISLLSFLFLEMAPGDYVDQMRLHPRVEKETLESLREAYGLDRPFFERYAAWLLGVGTGTWGFSFAYGTPVAPLLLRRTMNTLILGVVAVGVAWSLAVPVGAAWAVRARSGASKALNAITSLLIGVPEVVLALLLLVVADRTGLLPVGGMRSLEADELSFWGRTFDLLRHLVLPVIALSLPAFAAISRHVRTVVADVLEQPHIRNARALGTSRWTLMLRHVLRPAASPLIALASLSVASLLSGSLVVEVVMGWPGLGPFLLEAILARDVHVVIGGVMCSAVLVVAGGLAADLLLYWNDPRIARA